MEGLDKSGAFFGTMWINKKENLAVALLEQGLAYVFGPSADNSAYVNHLYTAENNAKVSLKKIWTIPRESEPVTETVESSSGISEIIVTEILDGCRGYAQLVSKGIILIFVMA